MMTKSKAKIKIKKSSKKDLETLKKEVINRKSILLKRKGAIKAFKDFVEETKTELKKVDWLDRNKLTIYFIIVLIITITLTFFVTAADVSLAKMFKYINSII